MIVKVQDDNPYSKHFGQITEAVVIFDYKGYTVVVKTNGTGYLEFEGAEQEYHVSDIFKHQWHGKGCIEDAIKFIHNLESLKD